MTSYFFADVDTAVDDAIQGLARARHGGLRVSNDPRFVYTDRASGTRKVGLVSGGGSGHEPLHAGLVAPGLLDAAVPGAIFASPHNRQVYEASKAVARDGGVLHIVKNYTGDIINFGIAAERLALDGIKVGRVVVDDDIATDDPSIRLGRRGTGATVLVEKVLGAAADRGLSVEELEALGNRFVAGARSVAVASKPHTSPQTSEPIFDLESDTLEYGVGIHGERSGEAINRPSLDDLVTRMVEDVFRSLGQVDRALLFVNGLGATTDMELYIILDKAAGLLEQRGVSVDRVLAGSIVTALDMKGFSLTLARLDDEIQELWDDRGAERLWI